MSYVPKAHIPAVWFINTLLTSADIFLCPQRNFGRHIVNALSVRPASCPVHISYILWGRNSKFGVWMHLRMAECRLPFSGHCDLDPDLWLSFYSNKMSVRPASCPVHISYILWGRNSKFGVWMHLGMAECRVPFLGHCDLDLDLWPSFQNNRVRSISLILFEVGISNLVCGCILR